MRKFIRWAGPHNLIAAPGFALLGALAFLYFAPEPVDRFDLVLISNGNAYVVDYGLSASDCAEIRQTDDFHCELK